MTDKSQPDNQDFDIFAQEMAGVKRITQDTVEPSQLKKPKKTKKEVEKEAVQTANFYFSDSFVPYFDPNKAMQYVQDGYPSFLAKQLRKGQYYPDLILDLHGLTQASAKLEIAALINEAKQQHVQCVCVVHGLGSGILKQKTPDWLVQHPSVVALHQAPLEWGGDGALLVLLDIGQDFI
ncbi:endonuclease SmrB [Catenovulum sp. 2E275]|uniref:endonuclease SmrB n=1 Tax=Catenovulum sp. 2E275 TaxID=2980497 RepID=UPI0021CEC5A6|nr:endonuclease SmrB [Catenovulum sp. 2E275]MCU4674807.1 endonuclease SmrB [Catenovulum sp. 2E275]